MRAQKNSWKSQRAISAAVLVTGLLLLSGPAVLSQQDSTTYYLSLGDSGADGGRPRPPQGDTAPPILDYAEQLYSHMRSFPGMETLALQKMACGGETTTTMIEGGPHCDTDRSQLERALTFLEQNRGSVAFVTIGIGGNDILECLDPLDKLCLRDTFRTVEQNLQYMLQRLRAATEPEVPIVGMTTHNPLLAQWVRSPLGKLLAVASNLYVVEFNEILRDTYERAGAGVADVEGAFSTTDFEPVGLLPLNVARICQRTWACGPEDDPHPNQEGYRIIAGEFTRVLREPAE